MRERIWKIGERVFNVSRQGLIMGVLNVTPDSFSDGGNFFAREKAIERGLAMAGEGACFMHCPPAIAPRPRNTGWFASFGQLSVQGSGVLYPADGWLEGVQPDLLGEHLLLRAGQEDPSILRVFDADG